MTLLQSGQQNILIILRSQTLLTVKKPPSLSLGELCLVHPTYKYKLARISIIPLDFCRIQCPRRSDT